MLPGTRPSGSHRRLRGADGVDDTAVKFLLRAELKKKKKEEEKERKAEEEKHERRMLALSHLVGEAFPLTGAEEEKEEEAQTSQIFACIFTYEKVLKSSNSFPEPTKKR